MMSVGQLKSLEGYRLYSAMYEFTARSDDELSLNPGDLVWVCTVLTVHRFPAYAVLTYVIITYARRITFLFSHPPKAIAAYVLPCTC